MTRDGVLELEGYIGNSVCVCVWLDAKSLLCHFDTMGRVENSRCEAFGCEGSIFGIGQMKHSLRETVRSSHSF